MTMDFIKIILILSSVITICDGSEASEINSNSVRLTFYRLQTSQWKDNKMETKVHALLAAGANTYCANNPRECGMITCCTQVFKEGEVGKVADYPQNIEKDMYYKFYMRIPAGSNVDNSSSLTYVLSSAAIIAIVENVRIDIYDSIGYYITWANDEFFGIPPARTENIIMIIIAVLVLIIVIITAIALHFWNKKREHREKLQKKIDSRKSKKKGEAEKSEVTPVYNVQSEIKPASVPDAQMKKSMYQDSGVKSPRKEKGASNISDTDSAIKMDDTRHSNGEIDNAAARQPGSLPPLKSELPTKEDTGEEEEGRRERKKKKKEKKHRKKRSRSEGRTNDGYAAESKDTTEL